MNKLFSAVAATLLLAAPASAATIGGLSGFVSEGPNTFVNTGTETVRKLKDFNTNFGNPILSFADDATVFGRVWDNYSDGFTISSGANLFNLTITATDFQAAQGNDLRFRVIVRGGSVTPNIDTTVTSAGTSPIVQLTNLSGDVKIRLTAISTPGFQNDDNVGWAVDVAPVPLPASALLLLGGLAGLGAMKRRKAKA